MISMYLMILRRVKIPYIEIGSQRAVRGTNDAQVLRTMSVDVNR